MKLTIAQPALAALLAKGGAVAPKNHTVPIVNHLRLTVQLGNLYAASTDLDRYAEASCECDMTTGGEACVNATALSALVGRHPKEGVISLELDGAVLIVKCGRSKVKLPTLPVSAFPAWADDRYTTNFDMPARLLAESLAKARRCAGDGSNGAIFAGVYLHRHADKLRFFGTSKTHMGIVDIDVPKGAEGLPGIIVPNEFIDTAARVFKDADTISISASENKIAFAAGDVRIVSKLIAGPYIDYARAIPAHGRPAITLSRSVLSAALARAGLTTSEGIYSGITAIPREDGLELKTANATGGETRETLEIEVPPGFPAFGFTAPLVENVMAGFDGDTVVVEFEEGAKVPALLVFSPDEPGYFGVVATLLINKNMAV